MRIFPYFFVWNWNEKIKDICESEIKNLIGFDPIREKGSTNIEE
jgi:hypothetical protein